MAQLLKQSTQVIARFGPFVDKADGVTEEAGLAGNGTEISKNHGAFGAGPVLGTHDAEGWYPITLTTTHTDTLGPFIVKSHDAATHLPVWREFLVVPANIYDSLVAGSDVLDVSVTQWLGTAAATPTVAGVPEVDITHYLGDAAAAVPQVNVAQWNGSAVATPSVAGVPAVDVTHVSGDSTAADNLELAFDGTGYGFAGCTMPTVTTLTNKTGFGLASTGLDLVTAWTVNITGTIDTVTNVSTKTGFSLASTGLDSVTLPANFITASSIASGALASVWTSSITEAYGTDGTAHTGAQLLYLTLAHVGEFTISGTTKTLKKLDGSTTAATYTLDDADTPSSITRAS